MNRQNRVPRLFVLSIAFALVAVVLPTSTEHAAADESVTFALWDFEGATTEPSVDLTGNAAASAGGGLGNESFVAGNPAGTSGTSWSFNNWSLQATPQADRYFEFAVDLTDYANVALSFAERRSGTGPLAFELHYSTDGTTFTQIPATVTTVPNDTNWRSHDFDLSGLNADIAGDPDVQFRIFGYAATGTGGTWRIDDVVFAAGDAPPPPTVTFALWDFEGATTAPRIDLTGNAAAARGSGLSNETFPVGNPAGTPGASWSSSNWAQTATPDATRYFQFGVDLTDYANVALSFAERRSGTGPLAFELHYSTDGTAFTQIPATVTTLPNNLDWRSHTFDLSGLNDQLAGQSSVQFRVFGYGASGSGGTWRIDDVTFTASDTAAGVAPQVTCPTGVRTVETYATDGTVTATVAEGEIADLAIAMFDPDPAAGKISLAEVTTGPQASATLVVPDDIEVGPVTTAADIRPFTVQITATSDEGVTGSCTASIEIIPLVPIGAVQGVIEDGQTSFTSPLLNAMIAVRGVVTQHTMEGSGNRGVFLQNTLDEADGNPLSSDGIFLFNSSFTTLRTDIDGPGRDEFGVNYPVTLGDELIVRGTVGQFFGMTQLAGASAFVWDRTAAGLDVDQAVEIAEIDPPDDAGDSTRYFRRHLGMQMRVPADSLVVNGRDVFSGTDAEVWAIRGDHPVAQRSAPYERRVFRDAHPLDNNPDTNFDDGNGYRFVLGSFGVKASQNDPGAVLAPAKTFDTITEANRGGVYLSFGKYTVNVVEQLALDTSGANPAENSPVQPADRARELAVAAYNVENLYDFRDNPNSGCDFAGNPGCFRNGQSVTPPFDYVPGSDEEYQARLQRMAQQIRLDLHSPDVVLVQETEAQDVCTVADDWTPGSGAELGADRLDCDLVNTGEDNTRTDGRPDSLLELALVIAEQGGPRYDAAFDLDGGDLRGITTAYLYRTDRVELLPADPDDPVLGSEPAIDYDASPLPFNADVQNPKAVNAELPDRVASTCTASGPTACDGTNVFSRGPSVGLFRVWRGAVGLSTWTDVYLVNNHHSAGPDNRVLQRREQATYNARIAEAVLASDPDVRVVVGGDLNVFPRPDDPYAPGQFIHAAIGVGPSDQLRALYDSPLSNLYERLVAAYPASAFSFGFQGQAQTLDHVWVSPMLHDELVDFRSAKINVDWPADARGEEPAYGRFGASDHDPEAARFGVVSFDRVRALLDALVAEGRFEADAASDIHERLDTAERQWSQGRARQAERVLDSIVRQLSAPGGADLEPAVAGALRAEIDVLRQHVSG